MQQQIFRTALRVLCAALRSCNENLPRSLDVFTFIIVGPL
jgi:hypothetical protein